MQHNGAGFLTRCQALHMIHLTKRALEWLRAKEIPVAYVTLHGSTACGAAPDSPHSEDWCKTEDVRAMFNKWQWAYVFQPRLNQGFTRRELRSPTCMDCLVLLDEALLDAPHKTMVTASPSEMIGHDPIEWKKPYYARWVLSQRGTRVFTTRKNAGKYNRNDFIYPEDVKEKVG